VPANLYKCDLPLKAPLETSHGTISVRTMWVLEITDERGRVGLGEAAPLPGFGGETPEECDRALNQALAMLTSDLVSSWVERGRPDAPLGKLETLLGRTPCARHAVEGALLDLMAQHQGVPLAGLIAAHHATLIPVNGLVNSLANGITEANHLLDAGFGTVKFKLGVDAEDAARRLTAIRNVLGVQVQIRCDANGAWTLDQATAFGLAVKDANLEYIEQPWPAADIADLATLRRRVPVKIAVDESVRFAVDVGRIGAAQAADVVIIKPMFLGGWRATNQAVKLAASCGLEVVITSAFDGAIGRACATHYAAALNLTTRAQGLATGSLFVGDLVTEPLPVAAGATRINDRPGLGIGKLGG